MPNDQNIVRLIIQWPLATRLRNVILEAVVFLLTAKIDTHEY